nr:regulatory protein GemA [uncultured Celeribacter sp.]
MAKGFRRANLNQLINIAKNELGMDDDTYRAMLDRVTGQTSLRAMDGGQKDAVLSEMKRLGFKVQRGGKRKAAPRADVRYCHVLWRLLHEEGHARVGGAKGLNAFVRSRFEGKWGHVPIDIDTLTDSAQVNDVLEALKAWCRREGIPTELGGGNG